MTAFGAMLSFGSHALFFDRRTVCRTAEVASAYPHGVGTPTSELIICC
jgi:hypothetical protein